MRTLLAIDLSNTLYKAVATHQNLTHHGEFTGGLYGLLVSIATAINKVGATDLLFCRDMRPYLRSATYPEYKALRPTTRDEGVYDKFNSSMPQVLAVADAMGWPTWGIVGYESDDLIAQCVRCRQWRKTIGMSNDSDLYQLLDAHNFGIYKSAAQPIYTYDEFFYEWGMSTEDFKLAHAIMGTHNEIAGIDGIGPITVKKILRNPHEYRRIREKHGAIIDRNLGLIQLPHPSFPTDIYPHRTTYEFNYRKFIRLMAPYNIDVTASMVKAFEYLAQGRRV